MDKKIIYNRVNNSFKKKLIFHFGTGAGFYSEFNNMILCMLYCLKHNIRFILYSKDASFFDKNGWIDIFIPFCEESHSTFHHYFNKRKSYIYSKKTLLQEIKEKIFLTGTWGYKMMTGNYLTNDIFFECRTTWFENDSFDFPQLEISGNTRESAGKLIDIVYKFNPDYSDKIMSTISNMNLPNKYVGIHARGGDKIVERDILSYKVYIDKAEKTTSIRNAFILTDDYRIYEDMVKEYPNWAFYTLTFKDETGYDNIKFIKSSKERKRKELLKIFTSLEIMRKADYFFGTYSSNPGMFLGMCMPAEKIYCLDHDHWIIL